MKYSILYTDNKGTSHFKNSDLTFTDTNFAPPAPPVGLSEFMDASKIVFFSIPAGWFGDWHPAPKKQFFCCLSGEAELVAGDGEKRRFRSATFSFWRTYPGKGTQPASSATRRLLQP